MISLRSELKKQSWQTHFSGEALPKVMEHMFESLKWQDRNTLGHGQLVSKKMEGRSVSGNAQFPSRSFSLKEERTL
jgi:hypothetical protein